MPEAEKDATPSDAAQVIHAAFHEAWGGLGEPLDMYVTSPIWERIVDALRAENMLRDPSAAAIAHVVWNEGRESGAYWSSARGRPVDPRLTPPPSENPYRVSRPGVATAEEDA